MSRSASMRWARIAGELALTTGGLLLAFLLWLLFYTGHPAATAAAGELDGLQKAWNARAAPDGRAVVPDEPAPAPGRTFAVLRVPRFGSRWRMPVLEGTGRSVLRAGVGHYPGTALPGALGNFALAGHRTTWGHPFQGIERLRSGDEVVVQTRLARYTYRVTGHQVVQPSRRDLLLPVPGHPGAVPEEADLTLTTCHPEFSARQRWVVHGVLVSAVPTADGPTTDVAAAAPTAPTAGGT